MTRGEEVLEIDINGGRAEYEIEDMRDKMESSRGSRFKLIENDLVGADMFSRRRRKFSRESLLNGLKDLSQGFVIHPENRWYRMWENFILIWSIYSSFFTPMEFAFFNGLPRKLFLLDICGQIVFLVDIVIQFSVAYRDSQTYKMVYKRTPIALRYLKSHFIMDFLGCMPWDIIYKAVGSKEEVRYLLWIRLSRARRITYFFQKMEKDIRINYLFTRIVKLITVELYCTHTAACIFYFLATTLSEQQEGYTWIGSLKLGDYSYSNFRDIDLWTRYTTSMYFAIVTMATVGYGDIHAVNLREMIFVMIYVSFDMILSAYLIGNMTALIVKGSKTERYRDKMTDLLKYMNRNRLGRDIRSQIKGHLRLQYESAYTDAAVLQDIPISIRAKISQNLYQSYIENVPLFKGCSLEFISQVVTRVHEEFFLPGEVIMEQGNVVDQLYFVCHGVLEEVGIAKDGLEETVSLLEPNSSFGDISIVCNIPQPYTVRVCELCRLLRIDKQSFANILEIYFHDGRRILSNLLQGKESNLRVKQLESDIALHIGKHEAELALKVNSAAYHGDLHQLKSLIRAGADPKKKDYDGRSPLHLAASRGYEDITLFLIQEGIDINAPDKFGNTPLLEAIKIGHDRVASLLVKEGALLNIENAGSFLCMVIARGDSDLLRRLLSNGVDPNTKDYDQRTPLHVAASQGQYSMAKLLLGAGASVFSKDRWGNTPVDEARVSGNKQMISLLEEAKSAQLCEFPDVPHEISDKLRPRKCTVLPFHPWESKDLRKHGVVLWIPQTIEELVTTASEQLDFPSETISPLLLHFAAKVSQFSSSLGFKVDIRGYSFLVIIRMSPKGRRRCRSLPPDILSNLPDNIIDVILICLPCKEAVRTNILSKKWRYHWRRLTELTIDQSHWSTEEDLLYPTSKFLKIVYQLLTLHEGPITKFTLNITKLRSCPEIDFFIYLLSMNGIQHLVLHLPWNEDEGEAYKLSSLFTCLQLRHLALENCFIHPPSNFQGFDRLITLELCDVTISSELLGSLISHCSLLEKLVLVISQVPVSNMIEINAPKLKSFDFSGCISYISLTNVPLLTKVSLDLCEGSSLEAHNFHFVKFFKSCFALEHLDFQFCFEEIDIAKPDEAPTRLPFDHNRVKRLCLPGIVLEHTYETLCCFCLLRSFPYLEYLEIEVSNDGDGCGDGDVELFKLDRFADVTFNHLREVKLGEFWGDTHELEFLKLLLAKSPVLETVTIDSYLLPKRRSKILAEVSNFWHVSPKVEVICRDLQRSSSIFEDETNRWKRMLLYY